MTQGDSVIDRLTVLITSDRSGLDAGLAASVQESRQAGSQAGAGFRAALTAGLSGGGLAGVGLRIGQDIGAGVTRGIGDGLRGDLFKPLTMGLGDLRNEVTAGLKPLTALSSELVKQKEALTQNISTVERGSEAYKAYVAELANVQTELAKVEAAQNRASTNTPSNGGSASNGPMRRRDQALAGLQESGLADSLGGMPVIANVTGLTTALRGLAATAGPVGVGVALVGTAIAGLGAPVSAGINEFQKFEAGMAKVSTLTDKLPGELGAAGKAVLNISTELGQSYESVQQGLYDVLGAGVAGAENMSAALAFVNDAARLAVAGATDTATATDALTSVMNAYKLNASDTKKVSDGLFRAVQDGKMSFNELAAGIGNVTAIAADANVPLETVLASLATMTANGVNASTSIDYLRSLITAIINPSNEAKEAAADLRIEFNAQALASKGLAGVLQDVMKATGGNKEQLGSLLGGVEAITAATSIASGGFERFRTNLDNQSKAAGSTEIAYGKMASTLEFKNNQLAANWKKFMVTMGEAFAPLKEDILGGVAEMVDALNVVLNKATEALAKFNMSRNAGRATYNVDELQRGIATNEAALERSRGALKDPNASDYARGRAQNDIPKYEATLAKLRADLAEALQLQRDVLAANRASARSNLAPNAQGPRLPGDATGGAATNIPEEAGKFGLAFLSSLTQTFKTDKSVSSDCASIAGSILNEVGASIKTSANAKQLMKNAINAGFQEVALNEARPGDLVVYRGEQYGAAKYKEGSERVGYHTEVFAGYQDGQAKLVGNPGSGPTRVTNLYDQGNATVYRAPTSPFAEGKPRVNTPTNTDKDLPLTAEQIRKAQQLTAAIEKAQDALKLKPGDVGLTKALDAATQKAKLFSEASDGNARALAAVRAGQDGLKKSAGEYIATQADLKKYGNEALRLIKDQEVAQKSGNSGRIAAAKQAIDLWQGESKARASVLQIEGAAYQSRQQARDKAASQEEKDRREAEQRDKEATTRRSRVAEAARQGNIKLAEQELAKLEQMRTNDLRKAGDDAAKKAAVEKRYAEQIYAAQVAVAGRKKQDADRDAQNGPVQGRGQALKIAQNEYDAAVGSASAQRAERQKSAEQSVTAAEKEEHDKRLARQRTLNERQARLAEATRQGRIADARLELESITALRDQELKEAGDNAAKRLEVEKRYAILVRDAKRDIARAEFADAKRDAENRNDASTQADIKRAERVRNQASRNASTEATNRVDDATTAQTEKIRALRNEYSQLAESIRKQAEAGTFGADAQYEATKAFNALGRSAQAAGLTTDKYISGARASVWGLITASQDASTTLSLLTSGAASVDTTTGQLVYQTDEQLRGIGQAVEETTEDFFNLQTALEGVGFLSRDELGTLIEQAKLGTDAADALWEAWNRVNEGLTGGPIQERDNLEGRGVGVTYAQPDDPANGSLAPGEAERLLESMVGMSPTELGGILADLVAQGFGESDLAKLIRDQLQSEENAFQDALNLTGSLNVETGKWEFPSDNEVRGIGVAAEETTEAFFDLDNAIKTALTMGREELDDLLTTAGLAPEQVEKITKAWEDYHEAVEGDGSFDAAHTRFSEMFNQAADIQAAFDAGEISAEEFASQLGPLTEKMERLAGAAERNGDTDLAANYRDLAATLRNLIPIIEDTAAAFISLDDAAQSVGDGLASIFNAFGMGDFAKISSSAAGLFKVFSDGRKALSEIGPAFQKSFTSGLSAVGGFLGVVGAGINLVGQIGEAILNLSPGFQAWKKNLIDVANLQTKAANMNGGLLGNPYADALNEDAGKRQQLAGAGFWKRLWWGLTGSAPKVMSDEAAKLKSEAATIFADLGETISNTMTSSLMDAFLKADFSGVEEAMKKSLDTFVVKTAIETVIKKSRLKELVEDYADEAAAGGDLTDERAAIDREIGNINRTFQGIAPGLPGYGSEAGMGSGSSGSIGANLPQMQLGVPRIEVTLPETLTRPLGEFASAVPVFSQASTTLLEAARLLLRNGGGSGLQGTTGLSLY